MFILCLITIIFCSNSINKSSDKTKGKVLYSSSDVSDKLLSTNESYPWINFNLLAGANPKGVFTF